MLNILKNKNNKLILFFILFFLLFFIIENVNHRFWLNDFKVYYSASKNFFSGKPIYNNLFSLGSGYYKYSPFALIFFAPFIILPFTIAKILYFYIYSFIVIYFLFYLYKLINKHIFQNSTTNKLTKVILLSFFVVLIHIYREMHLGNLNFMLLSLFYIAICMLLEKKYWIAGSILGIIILFKPFFIILFPLFVVRKKISPIIVSSISITAGLFIPAIFIGFQNNAKLLSRWSSTMMSHNLSASSGQTVHTLQTILTPVYTKLFNTTPGQSYFFILIFIVAFLFFIFVLRNMKQERLLKDNNKREYLVNMDLLLESFILVSLIPNIVVTDTEHFLLSLSIIMVIINFYIYLKKKKDLLFYLIILFFIMYGGNWHDLWGHKISVWINHTGILGIGNILLIISFICIVFKIQKSVVKS